MTQEALKLALEALDGLYMPNELERVNKAIIAINEALAQPKRHELQAKGEHPAPCARHCEAPAFGIVIKNLKAQLAQTQEPVAVWELFEDGWNSVADQEWMEKLPIGTKLYTTPPQRKPLTEEEICLIAHNIDSNDWNDPDFKECWHEGFKAGFQEAEIEHNIKG